MPFLRNVFSLPKFELLQMQAHRQESMVVKIETKSARTIERARARERRRARDRKRERQKAREKATNREKERKGSMVCDRKCHKEMHVRKRNCEGERQTLSESFRMRIRYWVILVRRCLLL